MGAFERPGHPQLGQDAGAVAGIGALGVAILDGPDKALKDAQVVLDFTAPAATMHNLAAASKAGVAMIIGTTGISDADLARFPEFCRTIACVRSPSMSVAVNAVFGTLAQLARTLGDAYDVEIIEAHHHFKKDAPSGTAERMAEVIAEALGRDLKAVGVYGRHGTYLGSDCAYMYDKFIERGFNRVIYVWGADHHGNVPRMHAIRQVYGLKPEQLVIVLYQLVTLLPGGEEVRQSKRSGDFITLDELIDEIGSDPIRFMLLTRTVDSKIVLDLDLAREHSEKNPVYYVQYAHARIASILRKAAEALPAVELPAEPDVQLL